MIKKKSIENKVSAENYAIPKISKAKISLLVSVLAIIGFFLNFPFNEKIDSFVQNQLKAIPNCPVDYKDLQIEYLMPKIVVKDARIPNTCLGKNGQNVEIDQILININGPSYDPIGLSVSSSFQIDQSKINILQSTSFSSQKIKLEDTKINFDTLLPMLTQKIILEGNADIDGTLNIADNMIKQASINVESYDLKIPPQSIMIFNLPAKLKIEILKIKATLNEKNQLKIEHLLLGDERSPLRAKFSGTIYILEKNIPNSTIDLKGEFSLSDSILKLPGFSFATTLLKGLDKKDGFYQLKIGGTLGNPVPEPL